MFQPRDDSVIDYAPCRYAGSRLVFRGPAAKTDKPYCAILGGTEVFGKFVDRPFAAILADTTRVLNLGVVNGGLETILNDQGVRDMARGARVTVLQVMSAAHLSNRFFTVHPRRNDRFLQASAELQRMYPQVDFTEFHFIRHMLARLQQVSPQMFARIEEELKETWVRHSRGLAAHLGQTSVLLHLVRGGHEPSGLGPDPLFVDADMIAQIRPLFGAYLRVDLPAPSGRDVPPDPAALLPNAAQHQRIARHLYDTLTTLV